MMWIINKNAHYNNIIIIIALYIAPYFNWIAIGHFTIKTCSKLIKHKHILYISTLVYIL